MIDRELCGGKGRMVERTKVAEAGNELYWKSSSLLISPQQLSRRVEGGGWGLRVVERELARQMIDP